MPDAGSEPVPEDSDPTLDDEATAADDSVAEARAIAEDDDPTLGDEQDESSQSTLSDDGSRGPVAVQSENRPPPGEESANPLLERLLGDRDGMERLADVGTAVAGGSVPEDDDPTSDDATLSRETNEIVVPAMVAEVAGDGEDGEAGAPPAQIDATLAATGGQRRQNAILRGFALELVNADLLSERRAVSIALQARDSGQTFLRVLAKDRSIGDLGEIYRALGDRVGHSPIEGKAAIFDALSQQPWLPANLAEQWGVLPLKPADDGTAQYAAIDPLDLLTRDWVRRQSGDDCRAIPVLPDVFLEGVSRYRSLDRDGAQQAELFVPIDISWSKDQQSDRDLSDWDVPVVVDYVLHRSLEQGASDVHVEPTGDDLTIRCRIDGILQEEARLPLAMHPPVTSRIKVLANLDVAEKRRPQDGRISVSISDRRIDIRVSTLPTVAGEKIVMRLLDESSLRPRPEKIGLNERDLRILLDKISAPYGMILLSGPTGSGKTTTLYSCLSAIDRVGRNVVTVEDPVEYRLKGVHQMQVNEGIDMTFANGLRTILRQDPDVIMVGECRDAETASMAVQASLTGHLVFSTIHANEAVGVVSRLLDMNIDPFLVANALSLSIAQRLVRCHCEHCQTIVYGNEVIAALRAEGVSQEKLARLGIDIDPDMPCPVTVGCPQCRHTGYVGRQAVFELFEMSDEARLALMTHRSDITEFRRVVREQGMRSMLQNALAMIDEGRTSYSEVVRVLGEL